MDLGRNQYVVSLELGIFQGRPNSETVKIRPMAQEADSTHFRSPDLINSVCKSLHYNCLNVPLYKKGIKSSSSSRYVPISSSALRPLGAAYFPILLSEVEQEQRPSGNEDREAIVVGAGLCDGEGERAYTAYAPHYDISGS